MAVIGKKETTGGDVQQIRLGECEVSVSPLGMGAMTWGDPCDNGNLIVRV